LYGKGEAVSVSRSTGTAYLGKDILGSVRSTTNEQGNLEDRYEYDAFGTPYKGNLDGGMSLGYTGKPYDTRTGLYNYGYRDYQPATARFTTVDPIRDGSNWFAYVHNNPVSYVDILGLWEFNGDGTATAQPGDTLWGLADQITGKGANWTQTGYSGVPEQLQIGQTVDYKGMTETIKVKAFIIDGSGITQSDVIKQNETAAKVYNSQGIPVTFDVSTTVVANPDLLNVKTDLSSLVTTGRTITSETGVSFYSVDSFTQLYTGNILGVNWEGMGFLAIPVSVITTASLGKYDDTTGAHEYGHNFGLKDLTDANGNLLLSGTDNLMGTMNRTDSILTQEQKDTINQFLSAFPYTSTKGR
jgi:RHS repeat-associated protein